MIAAIYDHYSDIRYSSYRSKLSVYLWIFAVSFIAGMVGFFTFFFLMEFKKKCIKPGACFQVCFTIFLLVMALVVYGIGFATESLKVVATSFCGDSQDFLDKPNEFLFTLPEFARDTARECFFTNSSGKIKNTLDDIMGAQYDVVEQYVTLVSDP